MTIAYDGSDNNNGGAPLTPAFIHKHDNDNGHGPIEVASFKLYSAGTNWTRQTYANCRNSFKAIKFYIADVLAGISKQDHIPYTPAQTYQRTLAALSWVGTKWDDHPINLDLAEFFVSYCGWDQTKVQNYLKDFISIVHANKHKVGDYMGTYLFGHYLELGQDWRIIPNYNRVPDDPWDWHQYKAIQGYGDLSILHTGETLDEFLLKSTRKEIPPVAGEADTYFQRVQAEDIAPSDFAGNASYLTGYRIAKRGLDFPARLKNNVDAVQGYKDGGGKLNG